MHLKCEPDIVYNGVNHAVIDAKNKNYYEYYKREDFYQLYTYSKKYNSKIGILVYPIDKITYPEKFIIPFDNNIVFYAIGLKIKNDSKKEAEESIISFSTFVKNILSNPN